MLKPFQILWELIEFALQALFIYVLAVILCIGLIIYVIADKKKIDPEIQYVYEKVIIEKEVEKQLNNNEHLERIKFQNEMIKKQKKEIK